MPRIKEYSKLKLKDNDVKKFMILKLNILDNMLLILLNQEMVF